MRDIGDIHVVSNEVPVAVPPLLKRPQDTFVTPHTHTQRNRGLALYKRLLKINKQRIWTDSRLELHASAQPPTQNEHRRSFVFCGVKKNLSNRKIR